MTEPAPAQPVVAQQPTQPVVVQQPPAQPVVVQQPPEPRSPVVTFLLRVPFTASVVALTLVLGIAFGTLWASAERKPWYPDIANGLPSLLDGKIWTLATGPFFAIHPGWYLFNLLIFALFVGFAEVRLGTIRTLVVTVAGQVVGVLAASLFLLVFRHTEWVWAKVLADQVDVNFTSGALAALCVATATIRPPWRLRARVAIWAFTFFGVLLVGHLASLQHFFAVLFTLPFSTRLAGPVATRARALPTRHEVRLLAAVGFVVIGASQLIALLLPDRITPLGEVIDDDTWWTTLLAIAIALLVANGLRRGYRWAWWLAIVVCAVPSALALLVIIAVLAAVITRQDYTLSGLPQFVAGSILYFGFLVTLIVARSAFRVPRRSKRRLATSTSNPELAKELLRTWGGNTISWMTTWPENRHMVTADGQSYLAFRKHAGVAVALGDPVGPPGSMRATLDDFVALCDKTAMIPYLFSTTAATVEVTREMGWQAAQVAEDNLIDLPGLEFKGKRWQDIRTAINRAKKENVTFRMVTLADQPWQLVQQVEHLSQDWLGGKELPEMGFTLGGVPEALDREVQVALAIAADGTVDGILSWMPVYRGNHEVRGWTLDLMRRRDGGFRATIEFLIASSCLFFQEQGYEFLSLSGAPLARSADSPPATTALDKFLDTLGSSLEPVYGFRSLHAFKAKFHPRMDPMYMTYRDEGDLPRIGIGITKAYLPDAGVMDLLTVMKK